LGLFGEFNQNRKWCLIMFSFSFFSLKLSDQHSSH
jgi:hypothetical protein